MGRKGVAERKNTKTSSSSGASALLGTTGFIGFSDVVPSTRGTSLGGYNEGASSGSVSVTPFYAGDDSDLNVVCKRLSKKDSTTKLKALTDMAQLISERLAAAVEGLLPFWVYIYPRLVVLDNDRRVRESVFAGVLPQMLAVNRKAVMGVLGRYIMGPWYSAINDPCKEVANAATRAMEGVFPKAKKREDLLSQCAPLILAHVHEYLQHKPDTLSDSATCSPEEMEERFERVGATMLSTLSALMHALPNSVNARMLTQQTLTEEVDAKEGEPPPFLGGGGGVSYSEVLREDVTWRLLSDARPSFRRGTYAVLTAMCMRVPSFVRQTGQVAKLSQHVCALVGNEKEVTNMGSLWEAVLVFFHAFPRAWSSADLLRTHFLPRLLKLIRANFHSAAALSCPSLLPLLAQMPPELAGAPPSAYLEVADALWKASKGDRDGPTPYLVAVLEAATYLLFKHDPVPEVQALAAPLLDQVVRVVRAAVVDGVGEEEALRQAVATAVMQAERAGREQGRACALRAVEGEFWSQLLQVMETAIGVEGEDVKPSKVKLVTDVLCEAYDKLEEGSANTAAETSRRATGLSGVMASVFHNAVDRCRSTPALGSRHLPFLTLMHHTALRLGPSLLPPTPSPSPLLPSFLLPSLTATLASPSPSPSAIALLSELCTVAALYTSPSSHDVWASMVDAAANAGLVNLVNVLRAMGNAHAVLLASRKSPAALPPLPSLVSSLLAPLASSLCNPRVASPLLCSPSPAVDQATFFTLVLRGDFLTPSATSALIDQALASRSVVAMDGLLEATLLSVEADSKAGQLEQGRPRRVQVLMAAFEGLGPQADDSMRAVLRQDAEATDAFAKATLAVLKEEVARCGATDKTNEAPLVAMRLVRLCKLLTGFPTWQASTLLREVGLTDVPTWRAARCGDLKRWRSLYQCTEAFLQGAVAGDARVATLLQACETEVEGRQLVAEILLAGVEVGGPQTAAAGEEEEAPTPGPLLTRFLSASHPLTSSRGSVSMVKEPTVRPLRVLFGGVNCRHVALLAGLVAEGVRMAAEGKNDDWRSVFMVVALLTRLREALQEQGRQGNGLANEEAWTPVLMPPDKAGIIARPEDVRKGEEIYWFDRRAEREGGATWKKGVIASVHMDDEEKYFTVAKQGGGETQTEVTRLRRCKPPDVSTLIKALCRDLPHWAYRQDSGPPEPSIVEDAGVGLQEALASLRAVVRSTADRVGAGESGVTAAWVTAEVIRLLDWVGVVEGAEDWQSWQQGEVQRLEGVALEALRSMAPVAWETVASCLYLLAALPTRSEPTAAQELWHSLSRGEALSGQWKRRPVAGEEKGDDTSTAVAQPVPDGARVAVLTWLLAAEDRIGPAGREALEGLWSSQGAQALSAAQASGFRASGLTLAATQAALYTTLRTKGAAARLSGQVKADLFCMGLRGILKRAALGAEGKGVAAAAPVECGLLEQDVLRHCRLLAVSLIPADNKGLDWTTFIYADPDAEGDDVALNEPLWNAHVGTLLQALEVEASLPGEGSLLSTSLFHLLRPYLRSSLCPPDDDEEDEEAETADRTAKGGRKVGGSSMGCVTDLMALVEVTDRGEEAEMAKELGAVERRLPPRLHNLLWQWIAGVEQRGAPTAPGLRHLCGYEEAEDLHEALLEAMGEVQPLGDGEEVELLRRERTRLAKGMVIWLLLLEHVDGVAVSVRLRDAYSTYVGVMGAVPLVMMACFRLLQRPSEGVVDLPELWRLNASASVKDLRQLTAHVVYRTITCFPALVRKWWSTECERSLGATISRFVEEHAGVKIMQREMELIANKEGSWGTGDDGNITVRASTVTREVTATYLKDECTLEVEIRLPLAYPLKNVEVECTRSMGISADKWKRWQLQIITLLSMRDGSVVDAVCLWVRNLEKAFEGVEPCPICYSILQPKNMTLPNKECRTCHNKFHDVCVYKWFTTSGKDKCPLCQQPTILSGSDGQKAVRRPRET